MREPLYVAGPYAADTPEGICRNVARAVALGRLAAEQGFTPIVPHAMGFCGVLGDPHEADDGTTRDRALDCGVSLARFVGMLDRPALGLKGRLWVILRDDLTESYGTSVEVTAFAERGGEAWAGTEPSDPAIESRSWRVWIWHHSQLVAWAADIEARLSVLS